MPYLNYGDRELNFKIVYFGPGMSGKTTNLIHVHRNLQENIRGKMITLDTAEERTLFFDFLPLDLGRVSGFFLRFNLYTVPGQIQYEASRQLILDGADGVVFVADSQPQMLERNLASFEGMVLNLESYGKDIAKYPLVLQYNKRDCENPISVGTIERELNIPSHIPVFESVASEGVGVMDTIHRICTNVVRDFRL